MLIAQITDLHVHDTGRHTREIQAASHLARCIQDLNALDPRPDLVLVTGDLTDHGQADEYVRLRSLLAALDLPVLLLAGNHDDPAAMRAVFQDHAYLQSDMPFLQYVVDEWPLRIVALDTTIRGRGEGRLCAARLAWLADTLAHSPERPTLIMMHHPPFSTGIRRMDELGLLEGREAFTEIVAQYRNIERILCGHLHRTMFCRVGGTVASTCPGTAHQIALDLRPDHTLSFNFEPPGYQLHWAGPQGLVTHHCVVGDFPGPFPF
ncbi:phosphodiesterase [Allopusillimonas soli]|uniref:Phosphodiesterase n=1 Tax=Allopusillimonas soli TaxID=659016 RepID=A0A853FD98_9BURK|nr:phosphodiesterase [Allopusillimonas soli]NYT37917.1 phosphodiesterase [Allopusillimonas soli]TEA73816.1 phosphodiesterase [Allopusillimonas soli]